MTGLSELHVLPVKGSQVRQLAFTVFRAPTDGSHLLMANISVHEFGTLGVFAIGSMSGTDVAEGLRGKGVGPGGDLV